MDSKKDNEGVMNCLECNRVLDVNDSIAGRCIPCAAAEREEFVREITRLRLGAWDWRQSAKELRAKDKPMMAATLTVLMGLVEQMPAAMKEVVDRYL